jgi:hypothetical protein
MELGDGTLVITFADASAGIDDGARSSDDRIEFSPRLAKVPILWQGDWPNGSKIVSFKAFRYVYLQGLYGGCTGSGSCKLVIQPGVTGDKLVTNDDPVLITAIGIPDVHISQDVRDRFGELRVTSYSLIR